MRTVRCGGAFPETAAALRAAAPYGSHWGGPTRRTLSAGSTTSLLQAPTTPWASTRGHGSTLPSSSTARDRSCISSGAARGPTRPRPPTARTCSPPPSRARSSATTPSARWGREAPALIALVCWSWSPGGGRGCPGARRRKRGRRPGQELRDRVRQRVRGHSGRRFQGRRGPGGHHGRPRGRGHGPGSQRRGPSNPTRSDL